MIHLRAVWKFFSTLNREAAIDSLKNFMAVIGLSTIIGDFATMHLVYVLPFSLLALAIWYADYLRHDFTPIQTAIEAAGRLRDELQ